MIFDFIGKWWPTKKSTLRKPNFTLLNYSALLQLLPKPDAGVEEVYGRTVPSGTKFLEYPLSLKTGEGSLLEKFGLEDTSQEDNYMVTAILEREVGEIWKKFYKEHEGKLVVYSPLDFIEYVNTISEGWYLLQTNGKFTLSCNYRIFKEEQ